ncbi:MAG: hypothetical protein KGJ92_06335 [Actinomycetales bacterium]|nr:hypothetical protein [Actinomycetales bacterium]
MTDSPTESTAEEGLREAAVATLRGPDVRGARRTYLRVALALVLLAVLSLSVVTLVAAMNDNARVARLKVDGVPVTISVTGCRGNLGGSGSNVVDYTCQGDYVVAGTHYHEVIGSMDRAYAIGAVVKGVVDPRQHSYVVLASAAYSSHGSTRGYVVAGSLAVADLAAAWALWRVARRSRV